MNCEIIGADDTIYKAIFNDRTDSLKKMDSLFKNQKIKGTMLFEIPKNEKIKGLIWKGTYEGFYKNPAELEIKISE